MEGPLPGFFIIGAQKSGTSTLHRLLQGHPQAYLCDPKEPHYFSDPAAWERGERWYRSLFADAGDALAIGEASTTYSMYPHYSGVVERLTSVVSQPRVIYLLREPIARMRSAYLHALTWGSETRPIAQALTQDPRYLLTTSYALQAEQWLAAVPRDRLLLLSLDELEADRDAALARVCDFLGIDSAWRPTETAAAVVNASEGKRPPRAWWRALGELTLRTGSTDRVPAWMVRLNEGDSTLVRREVAADELVVPPGLVAQLHRALHADSTRLRRLWGADAPAWLQDESEGRDSA
ncbi:MAG TPA: sulfotransferase [Mycobacteriales bacterium]|nr:sulfotransferase [Mycobacteriales bacterium]